MSRATPSLPSRLRGRVGRGRYRPYERIVRGREQLAVSQCPAINGMQTLLQLDLLKQEVSHQAAKT